MPIETGTISSTGGASVGDAYLAEARATLAGALRKIEHCLGQLSDGDLWWRQHPSHNSIQTIPQRAKRSTYSPGRCRATQTGSKCFRTIDLTKDT